MSQVRIYDTGIACSKIFKYLNNVSTQQLVVKILRLNEGIMR